MQITERFIFIAALLAFLIAAQTRKPSHVYMGAFILALAYASTFFHFGPQASVVAAEERRTELTLITQAEALDRQAHDIIENPPRTKSESATASDVTGVAAHFFSNEQEWLTRAEHGKSLDSYVDTHASTAAIRIVAADNFLTGAVQAAVQNCNDHDSHLNIELADKIIADAKRSLYGYGDPHFPTPDLTRELDDSNDCLDQ